jgi:4-hydroxybenzoate polyprenyltransferase
LLQCDKPRAAIRAAVIPAVLVVLHYGLLKYAGRIGVLGIGTTIWYFAACARVTFARAATSALTDRQSPACELSRAA